jgi:hypothetical protein
MARRVHEQRIIVACLARDRQQEKSTCIMARA